MELQGSESNGRDAEVMARGDKRQKSRHPRRNLFAIHLERKSAR